MYRNFILFNLVLVFCVVVLGAFVRLSDAGLGCPDWPGCYGKMMVPQSSEEIAKANEAFPERPLEAEKAWKEMIHRYLAGTFGIFILALTIASFFRQQQRGFAIKMSLLLLLLVIFQVALGMWTVTMKVMPLTVLGHLLAGMLILYLLFWMYLRTDASKKLVSTQRGLIWSARIALFVLFVQIALGGWTSSNYAALACPDFPTCFSSWWPKVDYYGGFVFWPITDIDYEGGTLRGSARVAIHWVHRVGALVTFIVLTYLALKAGGGRRGKALKRAGSILSILLLIQISLGMANVLLRMPLVVAVSHNAVAALLLMAICFIRYRSSWGLDSIQERLATEPIGGELPGQPAAVAERTADVDRKIASEVLLGKPADEVLFEKPAESLFDRLRTQLNRTRSGLAEVFDNLPIGKRALDDDVIEELETKLLMADVGVEATSEIINNLHKNAGRQDAKEIEWLGRKLRDQLHGILAPCSQPLEIPKQSGPFVILVVGVNGVGKTTSIGKLAKRFQAQGHSVMLAAGDTFRAAAIEQLQIWGERNNIPVISQHMGADSGSVVFDGVQSAKAKGIDVLIADTAGRLHTKSNLMEELKKVKRIISKLDESAPHEILLVLDAGTGQNALPQVQQFHEALGLTGIALTKLDGTAKGGVIFALAKRFGIPIRFIGIGEGIDDLQDFDAKDFINALFDIEMVEQLNA